MAEKIAHGFTLDHPTFQEQMAQIRAEKLAEINKEIDKLRLELKLKESLEQESLEQERPEKESLEQESLEQERPEKERPEKERPEKERPEKEETRQNSPQDVIYFNGKRIVFDKDAFLDGKTKIVNGTFFKKDPQTGKISAIDGNSMYTDLPIEAK